jgi:hypothetical protein
MFNNFARQGGHKKGAYDDSQQRSAQGGSKWKRQRKQPKEKKIGDEELLQEIKNALEQEDDSPWQH